MKSIKTSRATSVAMLAAAAAFLASCGNMYPSPQHPDGTAWGKPQSMGWTTSHQMRQAEQKSIAADMPFNSVTASGRIVQ